ncbi:hypothetical protein Avbf_00141 [Armadillidium vulgare]|nr:hypothetical protein Avbf_00141 [Armadillidium vulgare]
MSLDQPVAPPPGDPNSNHSVCSDDVSRGGSDVTGRDVLSETAVSLISQTTDTEFEHEAADYQWLLDYDMPVPRYRESYSKDSHRDGSTRVSVLQPSTDETHLSYETLSRNIDANLAEIDMDDFRSEDIHQLLSLPNICTDLQDGNEEDIYSSVSGSLIDHSEMVRSPQHHNRCLHLQQQERLHQKLLKHNQQQQQQYQMHQQQEEENCNDIEQSNPDQQNIQTFEEEHDEEIEEEYSGVSEPPHIPPSFSVDSLDSDSIHEDLILTCQANKNNYTIAFEGSFVQYSDSDYQEPAESDGTGSGTWSTERLEGRSPAPNMTFSDQPYTTWSRVSRRSSQSRTPESSQTQASRHSDQSPVATDKVLQQSQLSRVESQQHENKSNSMPNLMRRSLMRRSLETSGHCVKVYDLQNSLRSSQLSSTRSVDANNFSLMRLFIKQKSLSKEAVSLSSSCTDPSQEGACSSSENHSAVNDSSDWPMNSQSENDMDGSASPVPITALNNHIVHERPYRGRVNTSNIIMAANQDNGSNTTEKSSVSTNVTAEGILNNNNLTQMVDNVNSNPIDNITSFEDSLKEINPCSKPPMTSPIREEPEGMDISLDSRCENKVFMDQSEKEKSREILRLKDNNSCNLEQNNKSASKSRNREINNKNIQGNKNTLNTLSDKKKRSESPGATKQAISKESLNSSQRKRQDSGNTSSGYVSNKGSTERIRRSIRIG